MNTFIVSQRRLHLHSDLIIRFLLKRRRRCFCPASSTNQLTLHFSFSQSVSRTVNSPKSLNRSDSELSVQNFHRKSADLTSSFYAAQAFYLITSWFWKILHVSVKFICLHLTSFHTFYHRVSFLIKNSSQQFTFVLNDENLHAELSLKI